MKNISTIIKYIRLTIILLGIPFILIELINPELLDLSYLFQDHYIFGCKTSHFFQIIVVGTELGERILKLKEARFHLFHPKLVLLVKRARS